MWESNGRTFLAETSTDGAVLGQPVPLAGLDAPARSAAATVHRDHNAYLLTVAWLGGCEPAGASDLLIQTWRLGRGPLGLSLTPANDNPIAIASGVVEAGLASLPGADLLLTWVERDTGNVCLQLRGASAAQMSALVSAPAPVRILGQTVVDGQGHARRVQAIEIAPLEFAVLWLSADRREIQGSKFDWTPPGDGTSAASWVAHAVQPVPRRGDLFGGLEISRDPASGTLFALGQAAGEDGTLIEIRQPIPLLHADQLDGALAGLSSGLSSGLAPLNFADFGFDWASHDLLQLAPSALHVPAGGAMRGTPGPLITSADEPLLIDLAAHGASPGIKIVAVDGISLAADGPTRIASGWLQARHDGHLTFTPNVDASGPVRLTLAGVSPAGAPWQRHLDVHVEGLYDTSAIELRNPVKAIPAHAVIAHHAQVAEIGFRGAASPYGTVSLAGVDADKFVVIGNGLFLRAGTRLEAGRKALDVAVHYKDGLAGAAIAAVLSIAVLTDPGGFLSLAMPARAHAGPLTEGTLVAEFGVLDQSLGGDRISLALLSSAGGRFALAGGNLVIASPQLFTHDPEASYDVVVRMVQPNGVAIDHKVTLHHEDIQGRPQLHPEKLPAIATPDEKAGPPAAPSHDAPAADAGPVTQGPSEPAHAERAATGAEPPALPGEHAGVDALPALHVDAQTPPVKGSSSTPDLGASAGQAQRGQSESLSKVVMQQHAGGERDEGAVSSHEKDLIETAVRRSVENSGEHRAPESASETRETSHLGESMEHARSSGSDSSTLSKTSEASPADTLLFKPGFGKETIEHVSHSGGEAHDILDLSLYGTTFEALRAAGAFEQVGNDVVLTLNPAGPGHSDQIVLKATDLHHIDPGDFKFS